MHNKNIVLTTHMPESDETALHSFICLGTSIELTYTNLELECKRNVLRGRESVYNLAFLTMLFRRVQTASVRFSVSGSYNVIML